MSASRQSKLQAAVRHGSRRLGERPSSEVSGRTRVSCDLTRENYLRLHMAVADLGASKIAILNALVELLDDDTVRGRLSLPTGRFREQERVRGEGATPKAGSYGSDVSTPPPSGPRDRSKDAGSTDAT